MHSPSLVGLRTESPGQEFFPQALCVVIFVLNVAVIAKALKNRAKKEELSKEEKGRLVKIAIIVILTALFLILWGKVHFVVLCSLLLIGIGVVLKQNLKTFIPGAIVSSVIVYVVFQQLLNVMLS